MTDPVGYIGNLAADHAPLCMRTAVRFPKVAYFRGWNL